MAGFSGRAEKKTALLTGASSGIGKAAALALTEAGYRVIGTSRAAGTGDVRDGIRLIPCDVTSDGSVRAAVSLAHAELGHIDLLVNNAGFGIAGAAEESSIDLVRALYDTNVLGVVRVTNAVLPIMRAQGSGRILNIGSGAGLHSRAIQRPLFGDQARPGGLFGIARSRSACVRRARRSHRTGYDADLVREQHRAVGRAAQSL